LKKRKDLLSKTNQRIDSLVPKGNLDQLSKNNRTHLSSLVPVPAVNKILNTDVSPLKQLASYDCIRQKNKLSLSTITGEITDSVTDKHNDSMIPIR